jgi:hypothetical protein
MRLGDDHDNIVVVVVAVYVVVVVVIYAFVLSSTLLCVVHARALLVRAAPFAHFVLVVCTPLFVLARIRSCSSFGHVHLCRAHSCLLYPFAVI